MLLYIVLVISCIQFLLVTICGYLGSNRGQLQMRGCNASLLSCLSTLGDFPSDAFPSDAFPSDALCFLHVSKAEC